jgi:hypothetical protein
MYISVLIRQVFISTPSNSVISTASDAIYPQGRGPDPSTFEPKHLPLLYLSYESISVFEPSVCQDSFRQTAICFISLF